MRILYAVQRYGEEVVGGSEAAARAFAEHLAARGHEVEVVTSCARSYVDWANVYEAGMSELNGVTVHRLPVSDIRRPEKFGPLHNWMIHGPRPVPMFEQQRWAKHMGPDLVNYPSWIAEHASRFDAAVFMTYLYSTTTRGLPMAAGRVPTVLQPTAHDEPPLWVRLYDSIFRLPDGFLFFTPEERDVVRRRFFLEPVGETIGIGIDLVEATDPEQFRRDAGIADAPYIVYVGRIDAIKGSRELHHFFEAYKERNPGPLKLVLVGEQVSEAQAHPDVIATGFVDEAQKRRALAGAVALVQPSRFESFSIVACESWVQRRPILVHRDCEVLVGQTRRSSGGIPYKGFAEFEAALDLLLSDGDIADKMGRNGRAYVDTNYRWETVLTKMEATIERAVHDFARR
jgi:glycosyltransferase involved in cell wall biosynthesis